MKRHFSLTYRYYHKDLEKRVSLLGGSGVVAHERHESHVFFKFSDYHSMLLRGTNRTLGLDILKKITILLTIFLRVKYGYGNVLKSQINFW